jgi:hypothetical protein
MNVYLLFKPIILERNLFFSFFILVWNHVALAQTPFVCQGQYYLSLTRQGDNYSGLYEVKVNSQAGNVTLDTISSNIGMVLNAMGYRVTDQLIYGLDPLRGRLRKIGKEGQAIDLGIPFGLPLNALYYAGDIEPEGRYLIVVGIGAAGGNLVKIDLSDPNFSCTVLPLSDKNIRIVDMAFDPFTALLWAHDIATSSIVTIDAVTGVVNKNFPPQPQIDQLGALFFDVQGNLYGYGSFQTLTQDKFVRINKQTGEISLVGKGPESTGQDGCSCPYTIEIQKTAVPDTIFSCTTLDFHFDIYNGSGSVVRQAILQDTLPEGFLWQEVLYAPQNSRIEVSGRLLTISDIDMAPGKDSIIARAYASKGNKGRFENQASLSNLPPSVGRSVLSDNPLTEALSDKTPFWVLPLPGTFEEERISLCKGDSVRVGMDSFGAQFFWEDKTPSSRRWLVAPDSAMLTLITACDTTTFSWLVGDDALKIDVEPDTLDIFLGNDLNLSVAFFEAGSPVTFQWISTNNASPSCQDCLETSLIPLQDGYTYIYMYNGDGCIVIDSVYIRVKKDRRLVYPNIISTDSGTGNAEFTIQGVAKVRIEWLKIYDRWGNLVHECDAMSNAKVSWNGLIKQRNAEQGVYTWLALAEFPDGYQEIVSGALTIIR